MKVIVRSNIKIYGVFEPLVKIELEGAKSTLRHLLEFIQDRTGGSLEFITDGEIGSDVQAVLINDKEYHQLDTALANGDEVAVVIEMAPLGGG